MKVMKYTALLAIVTLSLSLSLFARDKNGGNFNVTDSVQIGSTQLQPGSYKATWEGTGSDVQVKIFQGKNVVATAPAKLEDDSFAGNSVTVADPNRAIQEIHFGGLHKTLVFTPSEAGGNSAAANQN